MPTERRGISTGVGEKFPPTELQKKGMDDTQQANRLEIDTQMSTPKEWIRTVRATSLHTKNCWGRHALKRQQTKL